jgi:hypothetical protein
VPITVAVLNNGITQQKIAIDRETSENALLSRFVDIAIEALAKLRARPEFLRFLAIFACPRPVGDQFPIC